MTQSFLSDIGGAARRCLLVAAALPCCLATPAIGQQDAPKIPASGESTPTEVVGDPAATTTPGYVYRIGPEDRLSIDVRGEQDVSGSYAVRPDGRIALPLIGEIEVVGMTAEGLADEIEARLVRFIVDPVASVTVTEASGILSDRIRIVGSGVRPQDLPYRDGMTALVMLTEIGGLPPQAAANDAYVLRSEGGRIRRIPLRLGELARRGSAAADIALRPGDIVVVPQGFFSGEWEIQKSISVSETWTDNLNLAPAGFEDEALITELIPFLAVSHDGARADFRLNAEIRLQAFHNTERDFTIAPNIEAVSNWEWVEDLFFTDFSASITRQVIDSQRGRSASVSNVQNQDTVQLYRLSPYILNRIGDFATVETRYVGAVTLIKRGETLDRFGTPTNRSSIANDSFENTGQLTVRSGPQFSRLDWTLNGTWTHIDRENRESRRRREATLRLEYEVVPALVLIAIGGYQNFEGQDFLNEVDDPLYLGGFRFQPSPRFEFQVLGGRRDGGDVVLGNLRYDITDRLQVFASYDESARLGRDRLIDNLPGTPDDLDSFDPSLPAGLTFFGFGTRDQTARAGITGLIGSTRISAIGSWREQENGVLGGERLERQWEGTVSLNQPLPGNFALGLQGSFQDRTFPAVGGFQAVERNDEDFRGSASLSYAGFGNFFFSLRYSFSTRNSSLALQDFNENAVTLTAGLNF